MNFGVDILLAAVLGIVTWCVAAEGAWGAAAIFLAVLFSGLLAMNFFEPLADFLQANVASSWHHRWDMICLVGLFALLVVGFRKASEYLVPTFIAVHPRVYDPARWTFAALTGYVSMAILLTALHTTALPREFLGFRPERMNFFGLRAPDREWLGFTQYVSEKSLSSGSPARNFDRTTVRLADANKTELKLSTFPIRYATRRAQLAGGNAGPTGGSAGSGLQPRALTPRPSGGPGKGGF